MWRNNKIQLSLAIVSMVVGGVSWAQASPVVTQGSQAVYVGAAVNYDNRNWGDLLGTVTPAVGVNFSDGAQGGLGFTADLGYQFYKHFAVEGGYQYLPTVKYQLNTGEKETGTIDSYWLYSALRLSLPVADDLSSYVKIGAAYINNDIETSGDAAHSGDGSYWSPFFAAGLDYHLFKGINLGLEYTRVSGEYQSKISAKQPVKQIAQQESPASNIFSFVLSYQYNT